MSAHAGDAALALLRVCPFCHGSGRQPYNGDWTDPDAELVDCHRCDGSGDLLGALLLRAYRAGRDDALEEALAGLRQVTAMLEQPSLTAEQARHAVGLPL